MALDEALLESVSRGDEPPVLRLYAWKPGCVSLGQAQSIGDINLPRCHEMGWDVVRRPTGGRAVLHIDELTYSVIAPKHEPRVQGSIIESYRRLSLALLKALHLLGLDATADKEYDLPIGSQKNAAVCFEVPSNYEITVQGKKLIGSAQARKHQGVLQHGSLPLYGDITRIIDVMQFNTTQQIEQAKKKLLEHATTVESIMGVRFPIDTAAEAFEDAFSAILNIQFIDTNPTQEELIRAYELENEKYANDAWNKRK